MSELVAKIKKEVKKITVTDVVLLIFAFLSGPGNIAGKIYPFGMACIAGLFMTDFSPWIALVVLLGRGSAGLDGLCLKHLLGYFLLVGASAKESFFKNTKNAVITASVCAFTANAVYGAFSEFNLYFVLTSVTEIILTSVLIPQYKTVSEYYTAMKLRRTISKKELIALSVVSCGSLSGFSGFYLPGDITLVGIVSTFIIFFCAYNFSLGVCGVLGTVLGVLASVANPEMIYCIGSYSVAAIVCSLLKEYGKGGIVLGFVLSNAVVTFCVNGSSQVLINLYEILIAGGGLFMIPSRKLKQMKTGILMLLDRKSDRESARISSFKDLTFKRLNRISDAFSVLSVTMQKGGKKEHFMNREEQEMLLDNIKTRVCEKCQHKEKCAEKASETDEMITNLILITEKRGWVEQYDVPLYFKNRCIDSLKLVLECNKVFELYRVNQVWENRIAENRRLISGQLKDISGVVKSFADELLENCSFEEETEQNLIAVLDGLGIHVENVQVIRGFNNRLSVSLCVTDCIGNKVCHRQICTVLKKVTGRTFGAVSSGCDKDRCRVKFKEQENFGAAVGIARIRPDKEEKYGDSYAVIRPDGGKLIVALSDGMGTGEKAFKESSETVSLLEHLLLAGIDREAAIKLINSVLILKSYDENFATLDLLIADLYTGEGEFVKTGGACSYVCREGQVARISTAALPTGIIGEMETANKKILLQHGDTVLIASDGLTDVCRDDKWIKDTLVFCGSKTAQETADIVMKEALKRVLHCKDDMTALVIKIFEK